MQIISMLFRLNEQENCKIKAVKKMGCFLCCYTTYQKNLLIEPTTSYT